MIAFWVVVLVFFLVWVDEIARVEFIERTGGEQLGGKACDCVCTEEDCRTNLWIDQESLLNVENGALALQWTVQRSFEHILAKTHENIPSNIQFTF